MDLNASDAVAEMAAAIGASGPVVALGGGTSKDLGGAVDSTAKVVRAPAGIVSHQPDEMIVRCGAGTTVAELHRELARHGQRTSLPVDGAASTVGGVLASGRSDVRRLRLGASRDTLLEARYVGSAGEVVKAGAPVVKNVTGFDLCRLMCGSLGTLGLLAEVVLRTIPTPPASRWLSAEGVDPMEILSVLYRPTAVLWDGVTTWVGLEGHEADIVAETAAVGQRFAEVDGPPAVPSGPRRSFPAGQLAEMPGLGAEPGSFLAEMGVGTVHSDDGLAAIDRTAPPAELVDLHRRLKAAFDPSGRFAPGRDPLAI